MSPLQSSRLNTPTAQYFDLDLGERDGRKRRLQFTPFDASYVCRVLNALPGFATDGQPVTPRRLLFFMQQGELTTYSLILAQGLKHEDERMDETKAMKLLSDYMIANQGDVTAIAIVIRDAGISGGVWVADPQRAAAEGNENGSLPAS